MKIKKKRNKRESSQNKNRKLRKPKKKKDLPRPQSSYPLKLNFDEIEEKSKRNEMQWDQFTDEGLDLRLVPTLYHTII